MGSPPALKTKKMKRQLTLGIIGWLLAIVGGTKAMAQENNADDKKEKLSQEIIIRKNGGKDTKVILEITGEKVLINGKSR